VCPTPSDVCQSWCIWSTVLVTRRCAGVAPGRLALPPASCQPSKGHARRLPPLSAHACTACRACRPGHARPPACAALRSQHPAARRPVRAAPSAGRASSQGPATMTLAACGNKCKARARASANALLESPMEPAPGQHRPRAWRARADRKATVIQAPTGTSASRHASLPGAASAAGARAPRSAAPQRRRSVAAPPTGHTGQARAGSLA